MKIIIAGDLCPHYRSLDLIEEKRFGEIFSEVKPIIESADYSIVNLECPVVENQIVNPIHKCGPNLRCTNKTVEAIKYAGFKGVTLANNHVLDFGEKGLHDTVAACKSVGLDMVGVGDNLKEAAKILYKTICGEKVAFINCCENEFSVASDITSGANPLNPVQQFYAIKEAKKNADYVIVIVHGGHEMFQLPSPRMKELYHFFVNVGADSVINHHQHCYSGYEIYNGKPIFYGLGNFLFDWEGKRDSIWNEGIMVLLDFNNIINFKIFPYKQCNEQPVIRLLEDNELLLSFNNLNKLSCLINDDSALREAVNEYYQDCSKRQIDNLEPYDGSILSRLYSRGLLPRTITSSKAALILNHIDCESHRDKLLYALRLRL